MRNKIIRSLVIMVGLVILPFVLSSCQKQEPALPFEITDIELPLAEPGPYEVSEISNIQNTDEKRNGRIVNFTIYYPSKDGEPDSRGAPFPLIISDSKMLNLFGDHLTSHGFIVAGINGIDTYSTWDQNLFNQPLDYIFVLNQSADNPPDSLKGFIDTKHVGVWGYSFGGRNSVVLSGGRIDPAYYFENCKNPDEAVISYEESETKSRCAPYHNWDKFVEEAGPGITEGKDGFWEPITDDRILAVMPLSAGNEWLFGPRGFASSDKAILMTAGTNEGIRYEECYRIFEELGTSDKLFISFVEADHYMIFGEDAPKKMEHLAIAFFSFHLKGNESYADYFSEDFITQIEGLAWDRYKE